MAQADCVNDVVNEALTVGELVYDALEQKLEDSVGERDCDTDGVKEDEYVALRDCDSETVAQDDCVTDVVNEGLTVEEPENEGFAEADDVGQYDELPDAVPVQELLAVLLAVAVGVRTADRVADFVAVEVNELAVVADAIDVADRVKVAVELALVVAEAVADVAVVVEAVVVIVRVVGAEADAVEVGALEPLNDAVPLPVEDPVALAVAVRDTAPSTST